jgi:hypothetical protein
MATSAEKFLQLANFYNQMLAVMSAICVRKGGIAIENYAGRFFAADVVQFLAEYGEKAAAGNNSSPQIKALSAQLREEYEKNKDLTTPSQKPFYEMTLEEFEKIMNI